MAANFPMPMLFASRLTMRVIWLRKVEQDEAVWHNSEQWM
jgi:hypothetical protein